MPRTYLDHAATAPLSEAAREAMLPWLLAGASGWHGNASSTHREGQRARAAIEEARAEVAAALGVDPDEVVFTGSGTEADNLALRGTCWLAARHPRPRLVTTAIEHDAVRRTARWLAERGDAEVTVVRPGTDGVVAAGEVISAAGKDATLVSLMLANNEVGTIQPVAEVAEALRALDTTVHVDAVQALGRLPVRPRELGVHLLALSPHKVGGPKGCGVLFVRRGLKLQPIVTGGEQESGLRPGTESVATIVGSARAIAEAVADRPARSAALAALTTRLEEGLLRISGTSLNGAREKRVPGITNASFEGVEGEQVLRALDLAGFAVSTGSACTSGSVAPSHVLEAMGLPAARARGAVRFSPGPATSAAEIDALLAVLPQVLASARAHAA